MRSMGLEDAAVPNSTQRFQVFGRGSPTCFIAFHAIAFVCNASFLAWQVAVGASPQYHFAGIFVFLTIWGLTLQTLYFLVALITSVVLSWDLQDVSADWTDRVFLGAARGGTRLLGTSEGVASTPFEEDAAAALPRGRGRDSGALGGLPAPPVSPHNELCCAGASWSCCDGAPLEHGLGRAARVLEPTTLRLLALRDRLFSLEITVALCVSVGFWTLIFPAKSTMHRFETDAGDAVRSSWEHGATLIFVVIELLLVRHRYPRGACLGASLAGLFGSAYGLWNLLTFDQNGVWPYPGVQDPIAEKGDAAVGGVIAGAWVLLAAIWLLGRWLSSPTQPLSLRNQPRPAWALLTAPGPNTRAFPMPALEVLGRRLLVSTDDFAWAASSSAALRAIVVGMLGVVLVHTPACARDLFGAAVAVCVVNCIGMVVDCLLAWRSAQGAIPELDKRRGVAPCAVARFGTFVADLLANTSLLVTLTVSDSSQCSVGTEADAHLLVQIVAYMSVVVSLLQLCQSDIVSLSYRGSLHRRPFFVALDVSRRAVVVSVRGTMSLADCLVDADATPVDIGPWVRRWGLLAGTSSAGDHGETLLAHRAMWAGALAIVGRIRKLSLLETCRLEGAKVTAGLHEGTARPTAVVSSGRAGAPLEVFNDVHAPDPTRAEMRGRFSVSGPEGAAKAAVARASAAVAVPGAATIAASPDHDAMAAAHEDVAVDVAPGSAPATPNGTGLPASPAAHAPPVPGESGAPGAWRLVVTGHSLGAGVATLVGVLLSGRYRNLEVHAFAPPGGLVSPALARATVGMVTSYAVGKDMVPRLALSSVRRTQAAMLAELRGARVSKPRLLAATGTCGAVTCLARAAGCKLVRTDPSVAGCPREVCCGCLTVAATSSLGPLGQDGGSEPQAQAKAPASIPAAARDSKTASSAAMGRSESLGGYSSGSRRRMRSATDPLAPRAISKAVSSTAGFRDAVDAAMVEDDGDSVVLGSDEIVAAAVAPVPTMRMGGRIIHMEKMPRSSCTVGYPCFIGSGNNRYTMREAHRDEFREMQISTFMIRDHMPDKMLRVVSRVARMSE